MSKLPVLEKNESEIILDLEIPFKVYILIVLAIVIMFVYKYFFAKEEIFEFIEKSKKSSSNLPLNEEDNLNLLTQLNTKINRDYLDNSKYYNETGYLKIYGNHKKNRTVNMRKSEKDKNDKSNDLNKKGKSKIFIKKNKKVGFSNKIIYENENEKENENQ